MKPPTNVIASRGTLGGNETGFKISIKKIKKIVHILTNMYSNKPLAVIREYAANAWDAHRFAGVLRPIEITLPSTLDPFFTVRDYGYGLDEEELRFFYATYGESTKDESNDDIGSFGIGCKSALTYTNTFTVISVKDGWRYNAVIDKDNDGIGQIDVMPRERTDEPSGILVKVPVQENNDFENEARKFFAFWKPGSVLINGKEPIFNGGEEIHSYQSVLGKVVASWSHNIDRSYVVMGNVPYPIKDTHYDNAKMIVTVPIGSVTVTPNREELMYDEVTEATLAEATNEFQSALLAKATKEITNAGDFAGAWNARAKWKQVLGDNFVANLKYKGMDFPTELDWGHIHWDKDSYYKRNTVNGRNKIRFHIYVDAFIVTGFKAASVSSVYKAKVKSYMEDNDINKGSVYFAPDLPDSKFATTAQKIVTWDEIKEATKDVSVSGGGGANTKMIKGSWHRYVDVNGTTVEITELDTTKPIIYVSPTQSGAGSGYRSSAKHFWMMKYMDDDVQFIKLPMNRWGTFTKQFPKAITLRKFAEKKVKELAKGVNKTTRAKLALSSEDKNLLNKFEASQVDDPAIKAAIRLNNRSMQNLDNYTNAKQIAEWYRIPFTSHPTGTSDLFKGYPLISGYSSYSRRNLPVAHMLTYMNAWYLTHKS